MDAVKFIKESKRLCKVQESCEKCVVKIGACCLTDIFAEGNSAEKTVAVVEQWAKDHPVKTRQSEFLKKFPNADVCRDVINILPCSIEKEMSKCCDDKKCEECRKDYWLAEVTDND